MIHKDLVATPVIGKVLKLPALQRKLCFGGRLLNLQLNLRADTGGHSGGLCTLGQIDQSRDVGVEDLRAAFLWWNDVFDVCSSFGSVFWGKRPVGGLSGGVLQVCPTLSSMPVGWCLFLHSRSRFAHFLLAASLRATLVLLVHRD
jgi:hypothetical protein